MTGINLPFHRHRESCEVGRNGPKDSGSLPDMELRVTPFDILFKTKFARTQLARPILNPDPLSALSQH